MSASFWKQLEGVTRRDGETVRIGTVASIDSTNGTASCTMANGGTFTVRLDGSSVSVSDVVYIQFGRIIGTQQNVTTFADQDV